MTTYKGFAPLLIIIVIAVLLGGGYVYTQQKQAAEVSSATSATSTQSAKDVTAGWKTYTDDVVGIQFKYPPTWAAPRVINIKDNPYTIALGMFNISVSKETNKIAPLVHTNYDNNDKVQEETVIVGGKTGVKRSYPDEPEMFKGTKAILIALSDRIVTINYSDEGSYMNQAHEQLIRTIVFLKN